MPVSPRLVAPLLLLAPVAACSASPHPPIISDAPAPGGIYAPRATGPVYSNLAPWGPLYSATFAAGQRPKLLVEDLSFAPGPWQTPSPRPVRGVRVLLRNTGTSSQTFTLNVALYEGGTDWLIAGDAVPETPPAAAFAAPVTLAPGAFLNWSMPALPGLTLTGPDVRAVIFLSAAPLDRETLLPLNHPVEFVLHSRPGGPAPGASDIRSGFDRDGDGGVHLDPNPLLGETFAQSDAVGDLRPAFELLGDITEPPPSAIDLGQLADGPSILTAPLPEGTVRWYRFEIAQGAQDALLTYLDIDTEGSEPNLGPGSVLALYTASGDLLAVDQNDGSFDLSQLSFGIGRRPSVGGARQYDGRDGELPPGVYYVALAGAGALFGGGFQATGGEGLDIASLRLFTNVNGAPAGLALAPLANRSYLPLLQFDGQYTPRPIQGGEVLWFRFQICRDAADGTGVFVDADFSGNDRTRNIEAFLFDASGQLLISDSSSGPGNLPQFSFGSTLGRAPWSGVPGDPAFAGENGDLPEGEYYLAVCHGPASALATGDRWHIRVHDRQTSIPLDADLYTNITQCGEVLCAPCVADLNLDGGVDDLDIAAFFYAFEQGSPCADANLDEGIDDLDIAAFFASFEAGC